MTPVLCGRLKEAREMKSTAVEEKRLKAILDREPGFAFLESEEIDDHFRCPAFNMSYFYISSYGEVQPCPFVPVVFGNIREDSLEDILSRMWNHTVYRGTNSKCIGCSLSEWEFSASPGSNGYPRSACGCEESMV
jgi:MoaA/NifB/PqqE/SkfB family radical SAM enzyme